MHILSFIESYLPGEKGGGPVRALRNLAELRGEEDEHFILTRNHDYLDATPYAEVPSGQWTRQGKAWVYYAPDEGLEKAMAGAIAEKQPDWIYLHGALPPFTRSFLTQRKKNKVWQTIPVLLAPHGNLSATALRHHFLRKMAWLSYAKIRGLYGDIIWHAASDREAGQIRGVFGEKASIRVVPLAAGIPTSPKASDFAQGFVGQDGAAGRSEVLRLVYFGRIVPEKNLLFALDLLARFAAQNPKQKIRYELLGPVDPVYQDKIESAARRMPFSVEVVLLGALDQPSLHAHLEKTCPTALFLPSSTENFSYTILESLQMGLPVLISDQTPWRGLAEEGIGWDLPLTDEDAWLEALQTLAGEEPAQSQQRRQRSQKYAQKWVADTQAGLERMFRR